MKTMTCKQLGGPDSCTEEFHAETFEEMAELSKKHALEMARNNEENHLKAIQEMRELMENDPEALREWMEDKESQFESL